MPHPAEHRREVRALRAPDSFCRLRPADPRERDRDTLALVALAEDQHLVDLARELDEANASLARLHAEHETLRAKLGAEAPPSTSVVRAVDKPEREGGAYRGADATAALEAVLAKANSAVANLGIENEMMRSRIDDVRQARAKVTRMLLAVAAIVGLVLLVVWLMVDRVDPKTTKIVMGPLAGLLLVLRVLGFKKPSARD